MQTGIPVRRARLTLTLGRGWALPALLLGLIVAGSYLPAHGVTSLADVLAATIAALGLVAMSLAATRWARASVLGDGESAALIGSAPGRQVHPAASARRRITAVAVGAAVSAAASAGFAGLVQAGDPGTASHAVFVVAVYANVALLLSNVVPMPYWPGWTLLLAILDGRRAAGGRRVDRAVRLARWIIVAEAAAIAALAMGAGDWLLLVLAGLLVWQGRMLTTVAKADNLIGLFLGARRLGDLAREFTTIADSDEPALLAIARRTTEGSVIAVHDREAVTGAIGQRQAAAIPPSARAIRSADVMVPLAQLELLRSEAPAISALAQLDRFGFGLVVEGGQLRYVEANDVLQRILLTAAIAQAVSATKGKAEKRNEAPEPEAHQGGIPKITNGATQIDPVCGMAVEPPRGIPLLWEGRQYRFCDVACRDTFLDDAARWGEPIRHVDVPDPHP